MNISHNVWSLRWPSFLKPTEIRIARAAVEWNHGGYTSEVVTLVGWMNEQEQRQWLRQKSVHMGSLNDCYWLAEARRECLDGGAWSIRGQTANDKASWILPFIAFILC